MHTRSLLAILIASTSLLACDDRPDDSGETQQPLANNLFFIRALGNRCLDLGAPTKGTLGAPVIIKECTSPASQQFRVQELDAASHDFLLIAPGPGACVGVSGPGPAAVGKGLETQACSGSGSQRFAFDGDALLVGAQASGVRVSREFVIEPLGANTNEGTRVVVGTRELSDAEYWRMYAVDNSGARPTTGFVKATSETELHARLALGWGTVIELELPGDSLDITQHLWTPPAEGDTNLVRAGVTLRGNRKFLFNGAEIRLTTAALQALTSDPKGGWTLGVEDQARITGLRLRGPSRDGHAEDEPAGSGILIQYNSGAPLKKVIVDHIDASDWTGPAIGVLGTRHIDAVPSISSCLTGDENLTYHTGPIGHVVGNFIHHNGREYGVMVAAGGNAYTARNLFFLSGHEVTADYNAANRYIVHDSLFTSEDDDRNQELDAHGECGVWDGRSHWTGGRAGDLFDIGWNTFLADRTIMNVRGTPCHYASFHDNVAVGDAGDVKVDTAVDPGDTTYCQTFVPNPPSQIVVVAASNTFDIHDPTRIHGEGDFGKGDFDGDGVDDLFLGTGVTWWFSSGGKAEWRYLNRMPERASALRFGDFDADGRTDVIAVHGTQIVVSWAGGSPWYSLSSADVTLADLAVGQFDSDKRADLFAATGTIWMVASGGTNWGFAATSSYRTKNLRFGDFTGDGRTDVFGIVGGQWQIVRAPNSMWEVLGPARSTNINELVVADFDGLGLADVARNEVQSDGTIRWSVSKDGVNTWKGLRHASAGQVLGALPIGNYDDIAGADALVWDDLHLLLASGGRTISTWSRQSMR